MSDAYRTAGFTCPACRAPLREFQSRWICDECGGMLIPLVDFSSACEDVSVGEDTKVVLADPTPGKTKCPACDREMQVCRVRVGEVKLKGGFATCEHDGLWLPAGKLAEVFAYLSRKFDRWGGGPHFDVVGGHTRREFQAITPGRAASDGLSITAWRNRPRKRTKTLTPVNAYGDQKLRCCVCADRDLAFMGDRYTCGGCHGVFVENAALQALVADMTDQPWQMPAVSGAEGQRTCPICAHALVSEILEGVTIDRCATHGVWFDPQELETALQHADAATKPGGLIGWVRRLFG